MKSQWQLGTFAFLLDMLRHAQESYLHVAIPNRTRIGVVDGEVKIVETSTLGPCDH